MKISHPMPIFLLRWENIESWFLAKLRRQLSSRNFGNLLLYILTHRKLALINFRFIDRMSLEHRHEVQFRVSSKTFRTTKNVNRARRFDSATKNAWMNGLGKRSLTESGIRQRVEKPYLVGQFCMNEWIDYGKHLRKDRIISDFYSRQRYFFRANLFI